MSDRFRSKPLTRRRLLLAGAALAALLPSFFPAVVRRAVAHDGIRYLDDEFVIVNGWVLKRDDLRLR
jgi:hypothetical protein